MDYKPFHHKPPRVPTAEEFMNINYRGQDDQRPEDPAVFVNDMLAPDDRPSDVPGDAKRRLDEIMRNRKPPVAGAEFADTIGRNMPPGWGIRSSVLKGVIGDPLHPHRRATR